MCSFQLEDLVLLYADRIYSVIQSSKHVFSHFSPQNSSLVTIQGLLRFKRLKFHLVCMTSLFTLVPYYPPWDRSKKSVYQATLLCSNPPRLEPSNPRTRRGPRGPKRSKWSKSKREFMNLCEGRSRNSLSSPD